MNTVTSNDGTLIAYHRRGEGPSLLLVHGTTADQRRWAGIAPRLEQEFTVYAMDRRGRGGSGDGADYALMREAEDVAAVVRALEPPVTILGHSYGALCALEAALLTEVHRMILYEPPIPLGGTLYPPGVPARMQALIDGGQLEAALDLMLREVVRMPDHDLATYRQSPMWNIRVQLAHTIPREMQVERTYTFVPGRYTTLGAPTLLLLGGDSPPVFRDAIQALDAALPSSTVVVMPGQQHIAIDTNPDLFLREVLAFLRT
jgi:pimeloyl-ACP methyl ester carboxylesterase